MITPGRKPQKVFAIREVKKNGPYETDHFDSVKEAAEFHKTETTTIHKKIATGSKLKGTGWCFDYAMEAKNDNK